MISHKLFAEELRYRGGDIRYKIFNHKFIFVKCKCIRNNLYLNSETNISSEDFKYGEDILYNFFGFDL